MKINPILDTLREHLPLRSCYVNTLRTPGSPLVFNLKKPGAGRFIRKEEFEPAEAAVEVRSAEVTRDVTITINPVWSDLEQLESWIEEAAWELGAWDMSRYSKPPEADPDNWRDQPGNGIGVAFCGLDEVYNIPNSTGKGDASNWAIGDQAAHSGWWSWCFKPNAGWEPGSVTLKIARKGDSSLREDGTRPSPFPSWKAGGEFQGRSGQWWLGLAKSFETADQPGHALRIVWDFRKLTLGY